MPKRGWVWVGPDESNPPAKKRATTAARKKATSTAAKPAAAKSTRTKADSTAPNWTQRSEWSQEKPTGEWAKKCVDTWCLLAPYDTRITEEEWKIYYEERSFLDKVNTQRGDESGPIESEDLNQETWPILRRSGEDVAAAIMGSNLDDQERKRKIAHTLLGSLYFTGLMGGDEGDNKPEPRNLDATTRLYSPFGIGTSIDFHYEYYYRRRSGEDEHAVARTIRDCDAKKPLKCAAEPDSENGEKLIATAAAATIFARTEMSGHTVPEAEVKKFEEPLFGCQGWLSPLKLADLLLAAGTVLHYNEGDTATPKSFSRKLSYYQGETKGKTEIKRELTALKKLETATYGKEDEEDEDAEICIPQRCLLLARQGSQASGPSKSGSSKAGSSKAGSSKSGSSKSGPSKRG